MTDDNESAPRARIVVEPYSVVSPALSWVAYSPEQPEIGRHFGATSEEAKTKAFAALNASEPKLWRDMSDAEQGALLLAQLRGHVIQEYDSKTKTWDESYALWLPFVAYRALPKPKRETVELYIGRDRDRFPLPIGTIEIVDGKPDLKSISMGGSIVGKAC